MKHSRRLEFDRSLRLPLSMRAGARWTEVAADPNAAAALALRAEVLRAAWRPPIPDRLVFLEERARGRRVLDLGCVAHDVARMDSPQWSHARLASAAERCIGVDVLPDGVEEMRRRGYEVVLHDLRNGLGALAGAAPFDVIVAGELIEHVESLDMLFRVANDALAQDGELLITTPNPYAPDRVRAGQLGLVWENVDHILYASPSGIAELAERHGLVLSEASVVGAHARVDLVDLLKSVRRRLRGTQWATVGYNSQGARRVRRVGRGPIVRALRRMLLPSRGFLGETFVYVVRRPGAGFRE